MRKTGFSLEKKVEFVEKTGFIQKNRIYLTEKPRKTGFIKKNRFSTFFIFSNQKKRKKQDFYQPVFKKLGFF